MKLLDWSIDYKAKTLRGIFQFDDGVVKDLLVKQDEFDYVINTPIKDGMTFDNHIRLTLRLLALSDDATWLIMIDSIGYIGHKLNKKGDTYYDLNTNSIKMFNGVN